MDGLAISGRLGAQASEWIPNGNVQLVDARSTLDCETAPSGKTLLTPSETNFTLGLRFFGVGVQIFGALPASSGSGGVSFIMDGVASSRVVFTGSTASGCESQLLAQMRTPGRGHHVVTITPQAATVPVEVAFYSALVWNPPLPTSSSASGDTVAATSPASDTPSTPSTSAHADGAPPDTSPSDSRTASPPSSVSSPSPSSTETNDLSSSTVLNATTVPGPGTATSTVTLATSTTASTVTVSDHTSGTVPAGVIVAAVLIPLLLLLLLWLVFILRKRRRRKSVLVTPLQFGAEPTSDSNNIAGSALSRSMEKGRMSVSPIRDESAGGESQRGVGRDASTMDADSNTEGAALVRAARRAGFTTETLLHSLDRVHKGGHDTETEWEPPMYR